MAENSEKPGPNEAYCTSCGEIIKEDAEICPNCGVRQNKNSSAGDKDRVTAGVLAILLGTFGVHKFYMGKTGLGLVYLCLSWTGLPTLAGIIEGIIYLTKSDEEFQREYA